MTRTRGRTRACAKCGKNRHEARYVSARGTVCDVCRRDRARAANRRRHLLGTYRITLAEYDRLLASQSACCAGCGESRAYNLSVDHDHRVAATDGTRASVRGLLCKRCNKVLRDVRDNADTLRSLGAYLDNPPARKVLS